MFRLEINSGIFFINQSSIYYLPTVFGTGVITVFDLLPAGGFWDENKKLKKNKNKKEIKNLVSLILISHQTK